MASQQQAQCKYFATQNLCASNNNSRMQHNPLENNECIDTDPISNYTTLLYSFYESKSFYIKKRAGSIFLF